MNKELALQLKLVNISPPRFLTADEIIGMVNKRVEIEKLKLRDKK